MLHASRTTSPARAFHHASPRSQSHLLPQSLLHSLLNTAVLVVALCFGQAGLAQTGANDASPAPLSGDLVQVNVNEADAATIADILVGIGMSRAQAIVDYREEHGQFQTLDDLIAVKGIGEATVINNKDRIRFE